MSKSKFNIQISAEDIVNYVFQITNTSPKKLRCDLIPVLRNYSLRLIEDIIIANREECGTSLRLMKQKDCLTSLELINCSGEIANNLSYITKHQFEVLTDKTYKLFESIQKWIDSDKNRCKTV